VIQEPATLCWIMEHRDVELLDSSIPIDLVDGVHNRERILRDWRFSFMRDELTSADYLYSIKIGSLFGFFAGWLLGVALLLYVDSKELNQWPLVASIPLWNAFGWATYGFVVGGSGIFADIGRKRSEKPEKEPNALTTAA